MNEPSFSSIFARDFAVREAIYALLSDVKEPLDPALVVQRLLEKHPEVGLPPAELQRAVVHAAQEAGLPVTDGGGSS